MPFFQGKDGLLRLGFLALIVVIGVTIRPVHGDDDDDEDEVTTKAPVKAFTCIYCKNEADCASKDPLKNRPLNGCPNEAGICQETRHGSSVTHRGCIQAGRDTTQAKCALEHLKGCLPVGISIKHKTYEDCAKDDIKKKRKRRALVDPDDPNLTGSICYCKSTKCNQDLKVAYPDDSDDPADTTDGRDGPADTTDEDDGADGGNTTSLDKLAFLTLLLVGGGSRWWWSLNQNL